MQIKTPRTLRFKLAIAFIDCFNTGNCLLNQFTKHLASKQLFQGVGLDAAVVVDAGKECFSGQTILRGDHATAFQRNAQPTPRYYFR